MSVGVLLSAEQRKLSIRNWVFTIGALRLLVEWNTARSNVRAKTCCGLFPALDVVGFLISGAAAIDEQLKIVA